VLATHAIELGEQPAQVVRSLGRDVGHGCDLNKQGCFPI
jgi:hypothetical protein